jgi:hypothetical protein
MKHMTAEVETLLQTVPKKKNNFQIKLGMQEGLSPNLGKIFLD